MYKKWLFSCVLFCCVVQASEKRLIVASPRGLQVAGMPESSELYRPSETFEILSLWQARSMSFLHGAALAGHAGLVAKLLQWGANVNKQTSEGATPLHFACQEGNHDAAQMLLDAGADPDILSFKDGWSPLYLAARNGQTEVVHRLLEHGADAKVAAHDGTAPLHVAVLNNQTSVLDVLIRSVGVDMPAKSGVTPLMFACNGNFYDVAQLLLRRGANPAQLFQQLTPLHIAAERSESNLVKLLCMKQGVDLRARNENGGIPLQVALAAKKFDSARCIAEHMAIQKDECPVCFTVFDECPDENLYIMCCCKKFACKQCIIQWGKTNPRCPCCRSGTTYGMTDLQIAADDADLDKVRRLLEQGANAKINEPGPYGLRAIHFACINDTPGLVQLLLDYGADINACNQNSITPLHTAAGKDNARVVELLCSKGADFAIKSSEGRIPLRHALGCGKFDCCRIIAKYMGVDTNICTLCMEQAFNTCPDNQLIITPCCNKFFCRDCLVQHIKGALSAGDDVTCPSFSCRDVDTFKILYASAAHPEPAEGPEQAE